MTRKVLVKLLLDTHIVLWAAGQPEKLSESARTLLATPDHVLFFSAASIWEIVIKWGLGQEDFKVDPRRLRKRNYPLFLLAANAARISSVR